MNVNGEIKGDQLILTIDISNASRAAARDSKSGKSKLVATHVWVHSVRRRQGLAERHRRQVMRALSWG